MVVDGVLFFKLDPIFESKLILWAWLDRSVLAHSPIRVSPTECGRLAVGDLYIDVGLDLCDQFQVRPRPLFGERPFDLGVLP